MMVEKKVFPRGAFKEELTARSKHPNPRDLSVRTNIVFIPSCNLRKVLL